MRIGTVALLPKEHPQCKHGFLAQTAQGKQTFLLNAHGRAIFQGGHAPMLHASEGPCWLPSVNELVVFEEPKNFGAPNELVWPEGPCYWAKYTDYRQAYSSQLAELLPPDRLEQFPFLLDVLIVGRGLYDLGHFSGMITPMSESIYRATRVDDVKTGRFSVFFLAELLPSGGWRVTEFRNTYRRRKMSSRIIVVTPSIDDLLTAMKKKLAPGKIILVRMDIDQNLERINGKAKATGFAEQTRRLTVFTQGGK